MYSGMRVLSKSQMQAMMLWVKSGADTPRFKGGSREVERLKACEHRLQVRRQFPVDLLFFQEFRKPPQVLRRRARRKDEIEAQRPVLRSPCDLKTAVLQHVPAEQGAVHALPNLVHPKSPDGLKLVAAKFVHPVLEDRVLHQICRGQIPG